MNRTDKLYERLDQMEEQYATLLRAELEAVLGGGLGNYLGTKIRDDWYSVTGQRWRTPDARASELDGLEAGILRLRRKLGEPIPGKVVGIADALAARIKDSGEWSPGCNKSWLRSAVAGLAGSA